MSDRAGLRVTRRNGTRTSLYMMGLNHFEFVHVVTPRFAICKAEYKSFSKVPVSIRSLSLTHHYLALLGFSDLPTHSFSSGHISISNTTVTSLNNTGPHLATCRSLISTIRTLSSNSIIWVPRSFTEFRVLATVTADTKLEDERQHGGNQGQPRPLRR